MANRDEQREIFSKRMMDILNFGALNLALGLGYRLGLFEALDSFDSPRTLSAIAEKAGLSPRYIKEWLGIMVCGGIVEPAQGDDGENTYYLPKACGDLLTRRAGNDNLGVYTQEIPLLTSCAMDAVVNGFQTGDGIGYELYPHFQVFMSELAIAKHQQVLVDKFLPTVEDGALVKRLREGIRVCDLGCAEGTAMLLMARAFPASRFVGMDLAKESIERARVSAVEQNIANVEFLVVDAATLRGSDRFKASFDYVAAFDAIHDQTHPLEAIQGVHHILAAGGAFSMIDIAARTDVRDNATHPMGAFLYTVSLMHCMPVGLAGGGAGLGMMWGREQAVALLREGGFQDVRVLEMPHDPFNLHFYCRK